MLRSSHWALSRLRRSRTEGLAQLEPMYSRGFDVCDRADVQDGAALSNAPGRQSPEGSALVLRDGLPDWDGIGKVDGTMRMASRPSICLA